MLHHQVKSYLLQCRKKGTVQSAVLGTDEFMCLDTDLLQLLFWPHSCNICFLIAGMNLVLQRSHTNHVKLIQIGRYNAGKFQSFKQWQTFISCF